MEKSNIIIAFLAIIVLLLIGIAAPGILWLWRGAPIDHLSYVQHQDAIAQEQGKAGERSLCRAYAQTNSGPPLPGCKEDMK